MNNSHNDQINDFKELFKTIPVDSKKFKRGIEKSELDYQYKKLLWAFFHYKQNDKEQTFALLKRSPIPQPFYEGVRLYLLGLAHNHFGAHAFALEHLELAVEQFKLVNEELFLVYALATIALTYSNQRDSRKMSCYVDELKLLRPPNEYCRLLIAQVEATYLILEGNDTKAKAILKKCLNSDSPMVELFKPFFLIQLFNISLKNEKYKDCYTTLDAYKNCSGFVVKVNFLYMKTLLDHLAQNKPLYVYKQDFEGFTELCEQLMVVKNLASGDVAVAETFWKKLVRHNPDLYKENFVYTGGPCLFLKALSMYQDSALCIKEIDLARLKGISQPIDRLHFIAGKQKKGILKKADLIYLIWNEEVSETSLSRLRKLIFLYKKKTGVSIDSFQDSYSFNKAG